MSKPATAATSVNLIVLLRALCAAALAAVIGLAPAGIAAAGDSQLWSVAVHIDTRTDSCTNSAFAVRCSDLGAGVDPRGVWPWSHVWVRGPVPLLSHP